MLTRERFESFQQEAQPIISSLLRKEALELARQIEPQTRGLEVTDAQLFQEAQKLIAQLKWTACPIIRNEEEFLRLVKEKLLEGLELGKDLQFDLFTDLVAERFALQFGAGLQESLSGLLNALRENIQPIGTTPIMVKGEVRPVRPLIRHWLIDFLRNAQTEMPTEVDEASYLFNNPNAKILSETNKKILGRVLAFYDTFRWIARELAEVERRRMIVTPFLEPAPSPVEAPGTPRQIFGRITETAPPRRFPANQPLSPSARPRPVSSTPPAPPFLPSSPSTPTPFHPQPAPPTSAPAPPKPNIPAQPIVPIQQKPSSAPPPPAKPTPPPQLPIQAQQNQPKPAPKIDGNIVDLKEYKDRY